MRNTVTLEERKCGQKDELGPLFKTSFLRYLDDALHQENYEVCRDLIDVAYDLGAEGWEVREIIENYAKRVIRAAGRVS